MAKAGAAKPLFPAVAGRGRRKRQNRQDGAEEAQVEPAWSRPPASRKTRWGPEIAEGGGPGMPPPGWGNRGPPPGWGNRGPPPDWGNRGPPPDWGNRGPPPDWGNRGPPPDWGNRGPPPDWGNRGPPPDWGNRGPPPDWGNRGPPPDWGNRGPPPDWENRGPPPDWGNRGPPPDWGDRGPPPDWGNWGPPPDWENCGPPPDWGNWGPPPDWGNWGPPSDWGNSGPPPDWGNSGQGPPPPWGRGFPPREGKEGPWAHPENKGISPQDPRWKEWRGPPGGNDGMNRPCREGPWDRPDAQKGWRNPKGEGFGNAGGNNLEGPPDNMDSGHSGPGKGSDKWSSCPERGGPEEPGNRNRNTGEPLVNPGRSKRNSPERLGGEHQSLGREKKNWGKPEMKQLSPSCEKGDWGHHQREPIGQHSGSRGQPVKEPSYTDSARNESKWGSTERRGEECLSHDRSRRQKSPTGDHKSWGSPEPECSRSSGSRNPPDWEQSQSNPRDGGWNIPKKRGGKQPSASIGKREWSCPKILKEEPSSDEVQQDCGGSARSGGRESPDESQVDTEMCAQEIKEECADTGESSLERSGSPLPSTSPATPKPWTPREQVVNWWMRCQTILKSKVRQQFLSVCPRPTLPDGTSETPCINSGILNLLGKQQMTELVTGSLTLWHIQDEVLDMLAPALTIYEIAEEAIESDQQVDPTELREWIRQIVRHLGSINHRLTLHRRLQLLSLLNPRLRTLSSKLIGRSTNGMLFAEDKAKLLLEIIKRFPQLSEFNSNPTAQKKVPFKNPAVYRWTRNWVPKQSRKSRSNAAKYCRPNTVNRPDEQNHR